MVALVTLVVGGNKGIKQLLDVHNSEMQEKGMDAAALRSRLGTYGGACRGGGNIGIKQLLDVH